MSTQQIYEKLYDSLYDEVPIGSYAHVTVTGSINHNSLTTITYDTIVSNVTQWYNGSNPERLTVNYNGLYVITGTCQFGANSNNYRGLILRVNGSNTSVLNLPAITGVDIYMSLPSHPIQLNDGDYVDMQAYQNSNSTLAITAGLSVIRVG